MTNIAAAPNFQYPNGIVDYASVMTLELRNSMSGTGHDCESVSNRLHCYLNFLTFSLLKLFFDAFFYLVRFNFKNGTTDQTAPLVSYPLFGTSSVDIDLNTFINNLEVSFTYSSSFSTDALIQH